VIGLAINQEARWLVARGKYDTTKIRKHFGVGNAVHAELQWAARSYFFIYLDILDEIWPDQINAAAGYRVNPFSKEQYAVACLQLQE